MFNTTIDNKTYTNDDGYSSVNIFRQVLVAGVDILPNGTFHTVSIANSFKDPDRPYLDIDSVRLGFGSLFSFFLVHSHCGESCCAY